MFKKISCAVAAALIAGVTTASAQDYQSWGSDSGWNIFKSKATGGCFMERETAEGIVLQIGSMKTMTGEGEDDNYGYLGLYIPGDAPAGSGGDPVLVMESGPNSYAVKAHSQERSGYWGGYITSGVESDLAWDLQNRKTMSGKQADGGGFIIDLERTNIPIALKRLRTCASS